MESEATGPTSAAGNHRAGCRAVSGNCDASDSGEGLTESRNLGYSTLRLHCATLTVSGVLEYELT